MSTDPWTDDWLSNKEARGIRAEEAERALYIEAMRNRTIERAQIDTHVTEMVTEAEDLGIRLLIWVAVILFTIAAFMGLFHAFGVVFGLTALTLGALVTYLVKGRN